MSNHYFTISLILSILLIFSVSPVFAEVNTVIEIGECYVGKTCNFTFSLKEQQITNFKASSLDPISYTGIIISDPEGNVVIKTTLRELEETNIPIQSAGKYILEFVEFSQAFTYRIGVTIADSNPEQTGVGGCLIATATFGSELAPQVQLLREIRDNQLLNTESGTLFMHSFNEFYYSFSPLIADYERENPIFKKVVKLAITPLVSSLSILNYVDMNSEAEVLAYGISLILLNVGMYIVAPVGFGLILVRRK